MAPRRPTGSSPYRDKRSFDRRRSRGRRRRRATAPRGALRDPGAPRDAGCTGTCGSSTTACSSPGRCRAAFPSDPDENRLAVHTEDHPLEYLDFHGRDPEGPVRGRRDDDLGRGTYEAEKFEDEKVVVRLHGERVRGRYALFQTRGKDWMIHRMDPPDPEAASRCRTRIEPMKATLANAAAPTTTGWGYEIKWDGVRAIAYCEPGHVRLESRNLRDITQRSTRRCGRWRGRSADARAVLDGELVAFDEDGRPSFQRLQRRMHLASATEVAPADARDAGHLRDLRPALPRRADAASTSRTRSAARELEALGLDGQSWQTPAYHRGDGAALLEATREQGPRGRSSPSASAARIGPAGAAATGSRSRTSAARSS